MKNGFFPVSIFLMFFVSVGVRAQQSDAVRAIEALKLPGVTVTVAEDIPAGDFTPPGGQPIKNLPAFVRVAAVSRPTPKSYIRIEIWLPKERWNERFAGTGNGGGAGSIRYGSLASGIRNGFAVANTDMGTSPHVDSLLNSPERWDDFGHRATHEMTVVAKAVIEKYYRKSPRYSYFVGCSTGGEQALMSAQRYPDDYDGILAGAPANNRTHLHSLFLWNYKAANEADCFFTKEQVQSITNAVLAANVGKDGGYPGDRFLTDPRMATFNPDVLDTCLTKKELDVLKKMYVGPVNSATGEIIYAPVPFGSEAGGSGLFSQQRSTVHHYPFRWVWGLDFDYRKFDFAADMNKVDAVLGHALNANDPNLETVRTSGRKILMYTGTCDPLVPFQDALNYYERVVEAQGSLKRTQTFFRYFLVPGMDHCGGGPGPNEFGDGISDLSKSAESNIFVALVKWVEEGKAPDKIIATAFDERGGVRMRRPIFPYPKFPHYTRGDPALPSSYQGVEHERGVVSVAAPKYLK